MKGVISEISDELSASLAREKQVQEDEAINVNNVVKETRKILSHGDDIPLELEYDLLHIYAKNMLLSALISPFFITVICLAMMDWVAPAISILWLFLSLFTNGILIFSAQSFLKYSVSEINIKEWKVRFFLQEAINSVAWSFLSVVSLGVTSEIVHFFIALVLLVHIAFRMIFANSWIMLFYAGTFPAFLGIVLPFLLIGGNFYTALACMITGLYLFILFIMRGQNNVIVNMLSYRVEKNNLIVDLEEANLILKTAKFRAEQASLSKTIFLANMSHELRTPLNAIIGFSELMKDEVMGKHAVSSYKEYCQDIHSSGEHLLSLIEEILDLSRVETGNFHLNEEQVNLCGIGKESQSLLKLRAKRKGVKLTAICEGKFMPIMADIKAIRQIYINLLSNAVKFTPKGGEVLLTIKTLEDGRQSFSVQDNGPGIPENEISTVLTPFGQGTEARSNLEGGTGLGLPIVQELVKLHGGTFELHSKEREGTEVVVIFPMSRICSSKVTKIA